MQYDVCVSLKHGFSSQMKCLLGVFVDHIGDADRGHYFQEIGCYALEESFPSLVSDGLLCDVDDACIGRRVEDSSVMMLARVPEAPDSVSRIKGAGEGGLPLGLKPRS